ncbi:AAA family ATPase [Bacillus sp. B15-48]|nr:AAA family ATPase [Bacillus sp. B15-48]
MLDVKGNESGQILFVIDRNGNILISNEFTALSLGITLEELLRSNVNYLVRKGYYSQSFALEVLSQKKSLNGEVKTNTELSFHSIGTPIFDDNGEVNIVVITAQLKQNNVKLDKLINEYEKTSDFIVADSSAMKQILKACNQIAPSDCKVLLFGESGTGKEVLSKYIHNRSMRTNQSFISINCAAIPQSLFESELFGHEKGSFTGASEQKKGLLELANKGTLFLDEISEMPLDLQAKLLRVIDNPEIRRIGGTKSFQVDFRLICATNRDLSKMVEEGSFRRDLYYRINVIPIHIPPLKNRHQDIIGLADKFIYIFNHKYNKKRKLNFKEIDYLLAHSWPGNIRELKNYIERLVVVDECFDDNKHISEGSILIDLNSLDSKPLEFWPTLKEIKKEAEEKFILKILNECNGIKSVTAEMLGIDRTVLYRKLNNYKENKNT